MADITKEDLTESREMILEEVRRGFDGVHQRQDVTNGRVRQLEIDLGRQDERLKNHDERIKGIGRRVRGDGDRGQSSWRESLITKRDVAIVTGTVAIVVAVVKFVAWASPAVGVLKP